MSATHDEGTANLLGKGYDPKEVEAHWARAWENEGVFRASDTAEAESAFVVPIPPPNVTGSLHMGHALFCTLQDALVRYHRMCGRPALWQPGIDHAGIATQTVVERQLLRDGKTRFDLGREAFLERVWAWKKQSGDRILEQLKVMGASCDWQRTKFTMDPDMSRAVRYAFVKLYEQGLMYRATRLINWDPVQQTSLSDLEVDHEETNGELFEFAYRVEGSDEEIVVATTRPETMLADTAVAVHPDDARYTHLHGKRLVHPFVDRRVPIITDAILVDPKFGTGAVKVTPAHDFNDFATGKRHGLEEINLFTLDGKVNENGGSFAGLERARARTAVKKALDEKGLARGSKPHRLTVPKSQRSGAIVEPMISTQWFLRMEQMAKTAIERVDAGHALLENAKAQGRELHPSELTKANATVIVPEEWKKTYDHFLGNIQDWCVSRQLWWGHQIPAWHGPNGEVRVAMERPAECGDDWLQDPDVLDTWFSSALWPFSTQGWPAVDDRGNPTAVHPAYLKYYAGAPGTDRPQLVLETGYDILFFWVARMMMFGLHFTGLVPFQRVYLHGLVVDETGEKMSKVKGNVIDPLDLVHGASFSDVVRNASPGVPEAEALAKFKKAYPSASTMGTGFPALGADAVRFTLATYPPSNKRIALAPRRIEGYRHFLNKIWNATRFALGHLEGVEVPAQAPVTEWRWNTWILHELEAVTLRVHGSKHDERGFAAFRIDTAATDLYDFFWTTLCDWYLEAAKTVLPRGERASDADPSRVRETRATLAFVLEQSLRLLHPFVPYITEELWHKLQLPPGAPRFLAVAPYPGRDRLSAPVPLAAPSEHGEVSLLRSLVSAVRAVRTEYEVHPAAAAPVSLATDNTRVRALVDSEQPLLGALMKCGDGVAVHGAGAERPPATVTTVVAAEGGPIDVRVGLRGIVTADKEQARIERELKRIDKDLTALKKKLGAPGFEERAPREVVIESRALLENLEKARASLVEARSRVGELDVGN